jgi:hypothetical protein
VTGDAGTDGVDGDLPTLEDLFFQTKAMRRMAMSTPGQKPTTTERLVYYGSLKNGFPVGDRAVRQSPGAEACVGSSSGNSQGKHTEFLIFLSLARGLLLI